MTEQSKRVVVRAGARILTNEEIKVVNGGGRGTETLCTIRGATIADGDPGEC